MRYLLVALALAGCSTPPPTCAPQGDTYDICSNDRAWTCPDGDADVIAFNLAVTDACQQEDDPVQCILDAEYEYVEMALKIDCKAGGQVCVEDVFAEPRVATCEDP